MTGRVNVCWPVFDPENVPTVKPEVGPSRATWTGLACGWFEVHATVIGEFAGMTAPAGGPVTVIVGVVLLIATGLAQTGCSWPRTSNKNVTKTMRDVGLEIANGCHPRKQAQTRTTL